MHQYAKNIFIGIFFLGMLFFGFGAPVWGATITATVDTTRVASGESLNLKITTDQSGASVDTSLLKDFKVSPRGESTSIQIINSKYSKEVSQNFLLFPIKTGQLTIPALPVTVDGKTFYTQPITITVADKPNGQSGGTSDIFVRASISQDDPYVGQQIVYVFQLFQAIDISNARLQEPDFDGFFSKKIGDTTTRQSIINGRNYTITEVRYVLIADTPGQRVIKPSVLMGSIVKAGQRNNRDFPFDSFFNTRQLVPRQYMTDSIKVTVRPLPPLSDPSQSFSGLVGNFSISGSLSDNKVSAGDSTTLSVTVKGEGNFIDLSRLDISVPNEWKIYEDKPLEAVDTGSQGFYGQKTFHYALVPVSAGDYTIEPIHLVYFDLSKNDYQTISTKAFNVSVTASSASGQSVASEHITVEKTKPLLQKKSIVEMTGHDILPVSDDMTALKNQSPMSFFHYLLGIVTPPVAFFLFNFFMTSVGSRNRPEKQLRKQALQLMKDIREGNTDDKDILSSLSQAIYYAVRFRAGGKRAAVTSSEIPDLLQPTGCPDRLIQKTRDILEEMETLKYGGQQIDQSRQSELVSTSLKIIRQLCK